MEKPGKLKDIFRNRELLLFVPIYFFYSLTNLVIKLRLTPVWLNGTLLDNHKALMAFSYTNNEQSRLFQFLIPEIIHQVFRLKIVESYTVARLVFVFLAFLAFHYFLRRWFSAAASFAGVTVLSAAMAVTFLVDDLQESAPLLMLFFILGLWALREKKDGLFMLFMFLGGGLTNETMLVLSAGYFFYALKSFQIHEVIHTGARTLIVSLPAFAAQAVIRYINRFQPQLGGGYHLPDNIGSILYEIRHPLWTLYFGTYLYPFLIFSTFWLYACLGYKKSPRYLQRVFWVIPLFVAAHMITGIIYESRQMIPLGFILIPMSFFWLFGRQETGQDNKTPPGLAVSSQPDDRLAAQGVQLHPPGEQR